MKKKLKNNGAGVRFLYSTAPGRMLLLMIQKLHADRLAVLYLRSRRSRRFAARYARKNGIALSREDRQRYRSFRDFFAREREGVEIDLDPTHLISPCDGYLSAYEIRPDSSFSIKNSHYSVKDLLEDEELASRYEGGICLVFRLCASDYHHYCYIDDCRVGRSHFIPGKLHSVQPIACEKYPVFVLNRRSWCLMETENFGPVVQTEIGALIVGGIVNHDEDALVRRGAEKGRFELAGSTIVLLFEPGRVSLRPELGDIMLSGREARVEQGMWIGSGR